jgi:hypothetical protein
MLAFLVPDTDLHAVSTNERALSRTVQLLYLPQLLASLRMN